MTSGLDSNDPDDHSVGGDVTKVAHQVAPGSAEEPKTVSVVSRLDRAITLHRHEMIKDDGAGRQFQGRRLDSPVVIHPGVNPGIDKEFFTAWQKQNSGSQLHALFSVTDEN